MIGDRHFIDPATALRHFDRDLGLEAKAFRFDIDALEDLALKYLIADFHIGEIDIGEHIGKKGQELIPEIVPEKKHPVWAASIEARSIDYVRLPVQNRVEEFHI